MTDKVQRRIDLPLPDGIPGRTPYQGGITDPMWPDTYDEAVRGVPDDSAGDRPLRSAVVAAKPDDAGEEQAIRDRYAAEYAGRIAKQDFLTLLRADVLAANRAELQQVLQQLTQFIVEEVMKAPSQEHIAVLEHIPPSYRVTITLGFGHSLFVDAQGQDRYGLTASKPRWLKPMPGFPGDAPDFDPATRASDLILLICSDHPYVNTAIVRFFGEYFNNRFSAAHHGDRPRPMLRFLPVEQGFGRKDKREFLRFDDGIQNLQMSRSDLERLVYVEQGDEEPDWCEHGSYLVYRKIRENMPVWEAFKEPEQEQMIGRHKGSGLPLSRKNKDAGGLTPVFASPTDPADGPLNAHIRKVQPRRNTPDLFGINDLERRFLRRPYPFFDGLDETGKSANGLHFIAFMKSIQQQFEHVTNMWQMNPDFPVPGIGRDALYERGVLSTVDGGYYFCPPGLAREGDYFGSGMFA